MSKEEPKWVTDIRGLCKTGVDAMEENEPSGRWLNTLHQASDEIRHIAWTLRNQARNFSGVGNDGMAEKLWWKAKRLDGVAEAIDRAAGEAVGESVRRADASSTNLLMAALAGIGMASDDKTEESG